MPRFRPFTQGLPGLGGLVTLTNQQTIDAIEFSSPGTEYGIIIYGPVAPTDFLNNPWMVRCLWFDTVNIQLKRYNVPGAAWVAIELGALTSASQITTGIITLDKLSVAGGGALKLLRLNTGNTAVEYASLGTILVADAVPLTAINKSAASEGAILRVIGGITQWGTLADLTSAIVGAINSYDIQKLSGKVDSSLLAVDSSGTAGFISHTSFFQTVLADGTIYPSKMWHATAANGMVMTVASGNVVWSTPVLSKEAIVLAPATMPAAGANVLVTIPHSLGVVPKMMEFRLICETAEHGYVATDELSMECLAYASGVPSYARWGFCKPTATDLQVKLFTALAGYYSNSLSDADPPLGVTLTNSSWRLKAYLYA